MAKWVDLDDSVLIECRTMSFYPVELLGEIHETPEVHVHAHWVRWKEPKVTNPVYKCSNCGFDITVDEHPNVSIGFWIDDFRYCLCCGAKMDEEVE